MLHCLQCGLQVNGHLFLSATFCIALDVAVGFEGLQVYVGVVEYLVA